MEKLLKKLGIVEKDLSVILTLLCRKQLELTEKAHDFIAEKGWDEQYGARPLKRAIQKYVEDVLAEEIIRTKINIGEKIIIDYDDEKQDMVVNIVPAAERVLTE